MYIASLDAEKCFDTVCHISLFVKLIDVIPSHEWLFLYVWYSQLNTLVKWNGNYSLLFNVSHGTRQGSVLSPYLFNVFINQLLITVQNINSGVLIGDIVCVRRRYFIIFYISAWSTNIDKCMCCI